MNFQSARKWLFPLLFPLSLIYGIITSIRNKLFDLKILRSVEFDFPVISVGNITVGGTGKTPHVEYLVSLLSKKFNIAVLSRGYKRKTKGFLLAGKHTVPEDIGDESYQIYNKFDAITVVVDENRVRGIRLLKEKIKKLQCVILDDAYQHRYVKPGVSILLIDYYRPLNKDCLLPVGDLRERKHGINRANIVIVTKVPNNIKPIEKRLWMKELNLFPYQFLYFTSFSYGKLIPVFNKKLKKLDLDELNRNSLGIILLTGIADPEPVYRKMKSHCKSVHHIKYPDHHEYSADDFLKIHRHLYNIEEKQKLIITTEKDAVKIKKLTSIDTDLKDYIYFLPVKIKFLNGMQDEFDQNILKYVSTNKRISRLHC